MEQEKLSGRIRFAFGVGQWSEGAKGCAYSIFLIFYYVSVLGLPGKLAGTAMLIALCFDGVSDPLMGSISDGFQSRWGRRHPFMYGAALPFGLSFYLLFAPPEGLSRMQLFIWLALFATLTRAFLTVYSVPHMAMNAELTKDYNERTGLSAVRAFFSVFGLLSVAAGGFFFFFRATPEYPNGQLNPSAYPFFAAVFAVLMVIAIWLSAAGTHSEIPRLPQAHGNLRRFSVVRLFDEIRRVFQQGSFRSIFLSALIMYATLGTTQGVAIYFYTAFWGMTSKQAGIIIIAMMIGLVISSLIARPLAGRIGEKKKALIAGIVWFPVFYCGLILLRFSGLLPSNHHPIILPVVAGMVVVGALGIGMFYIMTASMLADITDEHDLVHSARQEAMYYSAFSLMVKVGTGLGGFFSGIIVDLSGLSGLADPAKANPEVASRLGVALILFVSVGAAISALTVRGYSLDYKRHSDILNRIKLRDSQHTIAPD